MATVLLGNGDGTFQTTAQNYFLGGFRGSIAIGDFSNDGAVDVAFSNPGITVLRNQRGSFATFAGSQNPVVVGQSLSLEAAFHAISPRYPIPTGTVSFKDGTTIIGSSNLDGTGVAVLNAPLQHSGARQIFFDYSGDTNFNSRLVGPLVESVNPVSTSLVLTSSADPSTLGQNPTFIATVVPKYGGVATGSVQIVVDGSIHTLPLSGGQGSYSAAGLGSGTHLISAFYAGDGDYLPSSSSTLVQLVNQAGLTATSTMMSLSSAGPIRFQQQFTATCSITAPSGTPTGSVEVFDSGVSVGSAVISGGAASVKFQLRPGAHPLVAVYLGDASFAGSLTPLTVEYKSPKPH